MFKRIEAITILSNEVLVVKLGNTLGELDTFSKRIGLMKGATLTKATLTLEASQTYLSGAEVMLSMNGSNLKPVIQWHAFETKSKTIKYDVSDILALGVNTFAGIYKTAYGVLNDNKANITVTLTVELEVPVAGQSGITTGNTTSNDNLRNVGQLVREGIIYIVALVATVGVVSFWLYTKAHPISLGKFMKK